MLKRASIRSVPLIVGTLFATGVLAQQEPDTDAFNGRWNVAFRDGAGRPHTAQLEIAHFAGTWVGASQGRPGACARKRFPVTVQVGQASALEFTVWRAQVSPGCPDITVRVRPVSATLLEGTVASGEGIRLSRQAR